MNTFAKSSWGALLLLLLGAVGCGGGSSKNDGGPMIGSGPWLPLKVGNRWTYQVTDPSGLVSAKVQGVTAEEPIGGTGPNKDTTAFKLVTGNRFNDPEGDVSYQALIDSRFVRLRELSIDGATGAIKKEEYYSQPWKLRLDVTDVRTTKGATWPESYVQFVVDTPKVVPSDGGTVVDGGGGDDAGGDGGDGGAADAGADAGVITTMAQVTDLWSVMGVDEVVTVPAGTFRALVVRRMANSGVGSDKTFWFVRGLGKVKESGMGEQTEELSSYSLQ